MADPSHTLPPNRPDPTMRETDEDGRGSGSARLPTSWRRFTRDGRRLERLRGELSSTSEAIDARIAGAHAAEGDEGTPAWGESARRCLDRAEDALENNRLEEGWGCLMRARRLAVAGFDDSELEARIASVRNETAEKLHGWRKATAQELLSGLRRPPPSADEGSGGRPPREGQGEAPSPPEIPRERRIANLQEALSIRDEHFQNVYRKLDIRKSQILYLGVFVASVLLAILYIGIRQVTPLGPALGDMVRLAMLAGLLGGGLSAALTLTRGPARRRIPEQLRSEPVQLTRPIFGAAAATAVYALIRAGAVTFEWGDGDWVVFVVGFLAGFSERWFLNLVESAGGDTQYGSDL